MANSNTHFAVGAITGTTFYVAKKNQRNEQGTLAELLAVILCSGFAGLLSDLIDPPTGPWHRKIGHSMTVSAITLPKIWTIIKDHPTLTEQQKDFLQALLIGFGSHLVLDVGTPAGLPLLT